jgi:hypothetical protein
MTRGKMFSGKWFTGKLLSARKCDLRKWSKWKWLAEKWKYDELYVSRINYRFFKWNTELYKGGLAPQWWDFFPKGTKKNRCQIKMHKKKHSIALGAPWDYSHLVIWPLCPYTNNILFINTIVQQLPTIYGLCTKLLILWKINDK